MIWQWKTNWKYQFWVPLIFVRAGTILDQCIHDKIPRGSISFVCLFDCSSKPRNSASFNFYLHTGGNIKFALVNWITMNIKTNHYFLLKSVQINWKHFINWLLSIRIIGNWNDWFLFLQRNPKRRKPNPWDWGGPSPSLSESWDLIWNCKQSQSNLGFGIYEIEEGSLSLLKWLLRLDMELQTESEQFGTCSPLTNKWHFHGLKLDLWAIVLSSYAF